MQFSKPPLSGRDAIEHGVAREIQRGDGLFASHVWKIVQELVEGMAALQIVDQRMEGHARADKYRRTAKNVWI